MQSLGLVALHIGSLSIRDKYYTYGEKDEIKLNEEVVMRKLKGKPPQSYRTSQAILEKDCENDRGTSRGKRTRNWQRRRASSEPVQTTAEHRRQVPFGKFPSVIRRKSGKNTKNSAEKQPKQHLVA